MASSIGLLSDGSASLQLAEATKEEIESIILANSQAFQGALSVEAYTRREAYLLDQDLTRNGGLTYWALVQGQGPTRKVLASCETLRKHALVYQDGRVEQVTCHGVASVFCPPENRGQGYAGTMINLLGECLRDWQTESSGKQCLFSILYSDIGKKFYAAHGWQPFPSAHVSLPPWPASCSSRSTLPPVQPLFINDIPSLCEADERLVHDRVVRAGVTGRLAVALVPDSQTVTWHFARERFVGNELYGKSPECHGVLVQTDAGHRVWCYWARQWYNNDPNDPKGNTMHIIRLVVDDADYDDTEAANDEGVDSAKDTEIVSAIASLLTAAQAEASQWNIGEVEIWNPTSVTLAACRTIDPSVKVSHRDEESIASLRWYGESAQNVQWLANEKFGWC